MNKYGDAHVVLDGHETHSTKDKEHFRRGGGQSSKDKNVESLKNHKSSAEFTRNAKNKAGLIKLLPALLKLLMVRFIRQRQMLTG